MAKFNTIPSVRTYEGAPAYRRDAKGELFLLAVSNMVGETTFYEPAADRDERFRALVHQVAVEDFDWLAGFLPWLRTEANLGTSSSWCTRRPTPQSPGRATCSGTRWTAGTSATTRSRTR